MLRFCSLLPKHSTLAPALRREPPQGCSHGPSPMPNPFPVNCSSPTIGAENIRGNGPGSGRSSAQETFAGWQIEADVKVATAVLEKHFGSGLRGQTPTRAARLVVAIDKSRGPFVARGALQLAVPGRCRAVVAQIGKLAICQTGARGCRCLARRRNRNDRSLRLAPPRRRRCDADILDIPDRRDRL